MRVQLELNKTIFIVRIISAEDGIKPGYICESDVTAKVYFSASEAVTQMTIWLGINQVLCSNIKTNKVFLYKKLNVKGILKNYDGGILFEIEYSATINALKIYAKLPICSVNEWDNIEIMTQAFKRYLKCQTTILDLNWHKFFIEWKEQESNIIKFMTYLKPLYLPNYEFNDQELRA
ncbi:hypothetical protein GLOIN_2v1535567 [Rhizophagus clarus]|uniref:Uncharacterized protein n=1 Tax=Rhizophagus clarus TaxID=94130 RepID=A0A8H3MIC9_9GLOM|nr:hypothetical protein GLOIN_2v1535567 [Rhizophagus clarus]